MPPFTKDKDGDYDDDSRHDEKSPPNSTDIAHNSSHNAPMPQSHKDEAAKHGVTISPGHTNHGPGHH